MLCQGGVVGDASLIPFVFTWWGQTGALMGTHMQWYLNKSQSPIVGTRWIWYLRLWEELHIANHGHYYADANRVVQGKCKGKKKHLINSFKEHLRQQLIHKEQLFQLEIKLKKGRPFGWRTIFSKRRLALGQVFWNCLYVFWGTWVRRRNRNFG